MFSRWTRLKGVSRRDQDQLAALLQVDVGRRGAIRFAVIPWAMAARLLMLQGATTIPPVRNDPLAIPAEKSA